MKDLTKYFLNLSKLSEEQQANIEMLTNYKYRDEFYSYLCFTKFIWIGCTGKYVIDSGKTELSYPEFIKLFEGGEGETSLQISPNLKEKVKFHLKMSVKAWHDWDEDLPNQVEVICNEVKRNRGQFLNVKRWLIIPPKSGLKECLVAEIDNGVQIHINHLVPAVF